MLIRFRPLHRGLRVCIFSALALSLSGCGVVESLKNSLLQVNADMHAVYGTLHRELSDAADQVFDSGNEERASQIYASADELADACEALNQAAFKRLLGITPLTGSGSGAKSTLSLGDCEEKITEVRERAENNGWLP